GLISRCGFRFRWGPDRHRLGPYHDTHFRSLIRLSRGAPIAPCDPTTLPSEMHTAGCLWAVSPHRLQVENQARLPTAPRGIGNDINGKERPQGRPTRSHPNLEPLLTGIACCPR